MKNKIRNLFIFAAVCVLAAFIVLLACNAVNFATIWVKYVILGCLLIIFVCLNFKFKKYSDIDEALSCAKRARKTLIKLSPDKDVNYVKQLSLINQITNVSLNLDDVIASKECYNLKASAAQLEEMKNHFKSDDDIKLRLDKDALRADTALLDEIIKELKNMR